MGSVRDDLSWRDRAACRNEDPELFFPKQAGNKQEELAKEVCARCPVREQCADEARLVRPGYGVWGGASVADRRAGGVKQKSGGTRQLKPCGTSAAYHRHIEAGEVPDDQCREAQRVRQEERRARLRAERAKAASTRESEGAAASG
ncbi:WhiB family transcriptional regulator [Streptomyces sp. NBC_00669]|uniref:WhiB family transcriptional regulator n=1 Tax=Streptomyces sp. NBC_00669 TaxID=2976011 RepID=UPI003FA6DF2F